MGAKMDLGLQGKVVLVTGGSRGLGAEVCRLFAAEGAHVAVNYDRHDTREKARAYQLAEQLRTRRDIDSIAVAGDVGYEADALQAFETTLMHFGHVDIVVNNAAIWPTAYVKDMETPEFDRTIAVDLRGPFVLCRRMVQYLLDGDRRGKIVNVVSQAAFHGSTSGHAHYAAAKAGLVGFTVSLAREVAPHGINVNAVAPGVMRTEMSLQALAEREDHYLARIPMGRIADPADVAPAVVFLASDQANYITGATIDVTGGMLMR
jgi:3-oxoacyl-[acyl-carrier protein] reductase